MKNFLRKFPYWYLLVIPALLFGLGLASNQLVLLANHGKFPVMMNELIYETFCKAASGIPQNACGNGGQFLDPVHSVMGPNSHLKFLADIFPIGDVSYSIGDVFLFLSELLFKFTPAMWLALTIRKVAVRD